MPSMVVTMVAALSQTCALISYDQNVKIVGPLKH